MGPIVQFEVWGDPGPQGSKSFKGISRRTGKAILVESSKKVAPWREQVVYMARAYLNRTHARWTPITGPVHLVVEFALQRQKDAAKTRRTLPDVIPDLSKLLRATEDALTTAGVWADDARVVDTTMRKRYAPTDERHAAPGDLTHAGARITVIPISAEQTTDEQPLAEQVIQAYERAATAV